MSETINNDMQMANREVMNNTFYDYKTGKPFLYVPYGNATTFDYKTTRVFARAGQGGGRAQSWDGQPEPTLKFETQVVTPEFLALLAGSDVINGAANIYKHEVLTSHTAETTATLTFDKAPVENTLFVYPAGSPISDENKVDGTLASTTFTFTTKPETDGDYECFYQIAGNETDKTISFKSNVFPKEVIWVGEAPWKAEDGSIVTEQMKAYKASPQQNFTMTYQNTSDPGTFSITFDLLQDKDHHIIDKHFIYD